MNKQLKVLLAGVIGIIVGYFMYPNLQIIIDSAVSAGGNVALTTVFVWLFFIFMVALAPLIAYFYEGFSFLTGVIMGFVGIIVAMLTPFVLTISNTIIGLMVNDGSFYLVSVILNWIVLLALYGGISYVVISSEWTAELGI